MRSRFIGDVSRETQGLLDAYILLLEKWNPKINLISKNSLPEVIDRHINDSLQLLEFEADAENWLDLGSGGGLPGIPVAIFLRDKTGFKMTLLESDARKCAFLRTVGRELDLPVSVVNSRIESHAPHNAMTISSRALAPLHKLLEFSHLHLSPEGAGLFLKGAKWKEELEEAQKLWSFDYECYSSKTDENGVVLKIGNIKSYDTDNK